MKTYKELELENIMLQLKLCEANMNFYSLLRDKLEIESAKKQAEITLEKTNG